MRFVYRWHAQVRMIQRNVGKSDVEDAVMNPESVAFLEEGKMLAVKNIEARK